MTTLTLGALGIAAALAVLDWWAVATRRVAVERVAKPAVVVVLVVATLGLEPVTTEPVRLLVLMGLGASLVGDVLLLPGGPFLGGVAAFAGAQLAYAVAFALRPLMPVALVAGTVVAIVAILVVGRPIVRASPPRLRPAVAGYLVAILAMAVLATGTGVPAALAGAWAFVASDAILAWGRFVRPDLDALPARRAVVHAVYHAAQVLIVLSLLG